MENPGAPTVRLRLAFLIIAVIVFVGSVPLCICGYRLIELNRSELRNKEREFQTAHTLAIANEIAADEQSASELLQNLSKFVLILSNNDLQGDHITSADIRGALESYTSGSKRVLFAAILNTEERGITTSRIAAPDPFLQHSIDRAYVKARAGQQTTEPVALSLAMHTVPALVTGIPVQAGGRVIGAVIQVEDLSKIQQHLDQLFRAGLEAYVIDGQGKLVTAASGLHGVRGHSLADLEIVRRFLSWKSEPSAAETMSYIRTTEKTPVTMLATYAAVRDLRWAVVVQRSEASAFASAQLLESEEYEMLVVVILGGLVLALFLSVRLVRPLRMLTRQAHALARHEFVGRIELRDTTEIGALATSFNSMADEIQRYVAELQVAANLQRDLFLGAVRLLAQAVDEKDPYTRGHSERVSRYSHAIALRMNLAPEDVEDIRLSALLHDVGKTVIDASILQKPGPLTTEEFEAMKLHTVKGANIVRQVEKMHKLVPGVELHHEALDGSGYPHGLKGEQIPLMPRIIAVADSFDAMTTDRPYRKSFTPDEAIARLKEAVGSKYATDVLSAFLEAFADGDIWINFPPEAARSASAT